MADFPEKENSVSEEEELSTIFSDPTAHKDIKVKNKKLLPKILALALALAVLIGGTVAVVKLIPVLDSDEGASSVGIDEITVKDVETDNVASVKVKTSESEVELYSETVYDTDTDSSTSSEAQQTVTWYTKQAPKELTSSSSIEGVVTAVAEISATRKIIEKTAEECGLTNPAVKAEVTLKDSSVYTVLIGEKSPDNSGYYLMLEGEESIYLVSESVLVSLQFDVLDFAVTDAISGFGSEMQEFESLVISGKNFPQAVKMERNTNNEISEYFGYIVTSPQKRLAKNIETIVGFYQNGVTVTGAYSYEVSAAALKSVGLDNPDFVTTMTYEGESKSFKFALRQDGNYAAVGDDSKLIHRVSADTLTGVVDSKATDYYETTIFMTHIDDIDVFSVKTPEKTYDFKVSKVEVAEDEEEPEELYNVTIDGKEIVGSYFQNFYSECISLKSQDFTVSDTAAQPEYSFTVTHKDGSKLNITFTKVSTTRYQCKMDGIDMGKVTASSINNIAKLAEKLANGEKIED